MVLPAIFRIKRRAPWTHRPTCEKNLSDREAEIERPQQISSEDAQMRVFAVMNVADSAMSPIAWCQRSWTSVGSLWSSGSAGSCSERSLKRTLRRLTSEPFGRDAKEPKKRKRKKKLDKGTGKRLSELAKASSKENREEDKRSLTKQESERT